MADHNIRGTMSKENLRLSDSVELLELLNQFIVCTSDKDKIVLLKKCTFLVQNGKDNNITNSLVLLLEKVIDFAIVPPFLNRDYFSYEKKDFASYPDISQYVLSFLNSLFNNCKIKDETQCRDESVQLLARVILKLVIFIGGYINCQLWSSSECEKLCLQLLNKLMFIFNCETSCDLLHLKACFLPKNSESENETLIGSFLSICKDQLSSINWHRNPFLSESFSWVISQITFPHLSNYLDQVMAVSLNFVEDHQESNKIRGFRCLLHLISNTSNEELCWYNHGEVIYTSLKHQMYCKDAAVVRHLFPCLFMILKVVDKTDELKHHHSVLEELMRDTGSENLLILRRLYISNLCCLVQQIGVSCICHIKKLLKIVEQFLEIDDGEDELARISALQLLRSLISIAWPRISKHSQVILKAVLKLLVDINGKYYYDGKETSAQNKLNNLSIDCLKLLIKVCPEVSECLQDPDMAKGLQHVAVILKRLNADAVLCDDKI